MGLGGIGDDGGSGKVQGGTPLGGAVAKLEITKDDLLNTADDLAMRSYGKFLMFQERQWQMDVAAGKVSAKAAESIKDAVAAGTEIAWSAEQAAAGTVDLTRGTVKAGEGITHQLHGVYDDGKIVFPIVTRTVPGAVVKGPGTVGAGIGDLGRDLFHDIWVDNGNPGFRWARATSEKGSRLLHEGATGIRIDREEAEQQFAIADERFAEMHQDYERMESEYKRSDQLLDESGLRIKGSIKAFGMTAAEAGVVVGRLGQATGDITASGALGVAALAVLAAYVAVDGAQIGLEGADRVAVLARMVQQDIDKDDKKQLAVTSKALEAALSEPKMAALVAQKRAELAKK